jgi:hypothetical protein
MPLPMVGHIEFSWKAELRKNDSPAVRSAIEKTIIHTPRKIKQIPRNIPIGNRLQLVITLVS